MNAHTTHTIEVINALAWHTDTLAAACGDGTLHLTRAGMQSTLAVQVTTSPLLGLITVPEGFATAAENGDIHLTTAQGETRLLASTKYMFLEHLAFFPKKNQILAAVGKQVAVIDLNAGPIESRITTRSEAESNAQRNHELRLLPHTLPSTISGLALSPIGPRLAASHYGGSTILALDNPKNAPRLLPWKGSHLGLTYSPDGKWLISAMQEQAIHLWRLSDGLDLQMRGYPSKITQFSWDSSGTILATNGGGGVPLWDFSTPKGPAGTQARVLADSGAQNTLVSAVAMHPKGPFCAIGYTDGLTLLTQTAEDRAVLLHHPTEQPTTHLAWHPTGTYLATANAAGTLTLTDFAQLV